MVMPCHHLHLVKCTPGCPPSDLLHPSADLSEPMCPTRVWLTSFSETGVHPLMIFSAVTLGFAARSCSASSLLSFICSRGVQVPQGLFCLGYCLVFVLRGISQSLCHCHDYIRCPYRWTCNTFVHELYCIHCSDCFCTTSQLHWAPKMLCHLGPRNIVWRNQVALMACDYNHARKTDKNVLILLGPDWMDKAYCKSSSSVSTIDDAIHASEKICCIL